MPSIGRLSILKLIISTVFVVVASFLFQPPEVNASGCSQYGFMAYEVGESCRCLNGYVMGTFLGSPYCVSVQSYCWDNHGFGSEYDYLSGQCKCSRGYRVDSSTNTCISGSTYCLRNFGYASQYNSLENKCECSYGYVVTENYLGNSECTLCTTKHGIYASYNGLSKTCECASEYTFDDEGKCVKKQNNTYFILKELDTVTRKAIIVTEYDRRAFVVEYSILGCYSFSFKRYLNQRIVVNLGTDFNLDRGDKIVLQNDNETCAIQSVLSVSSSYSLINSESVNQGIIISPIDNKVAERLKGRILIQVESRGEAWYVNIKDKRRYYMADGNEAFKVMRNLGVGITNKDLDKIKNNKFFAKQNSGKILLQVESKGEAFYIDFNGNSHYLKDGAAAYEVMRSLGLGITNSEINKIAQGNIY